MGIVIAPPQVMLLAVFGKLTIFAGKPRIVGVPSSFDGI